MVAKKKETKKPTKPVAGKSPPAKAKPAKKKK
jgi:hypothetical protein